MEEVVFVFSGNFLVLGRVCGVLHHTENVESEEGVLGKVNVLIHAHAEVVSGSEGS